MAVYVGGGNTSSGVAKGARREKAARNWTRSWREAFPTLTCSWSAAEWLLEMQFPQTSAEQLPSTWETLSGKEVQGGQGDGPAALKGSSQGV